MDGFTIKDARGEDMVAHPSTQGALTALQWLIKNNINPLKIIDIGCGSGILSLVSAQHWPNASILATDISPQALADCRSNSTANGLSGRIRGVRSESAGNSEIKALAPYELLIANVLASYHIANASHYRDIATPQAWLIVSGVRAWEKDPVNAALKTAGFLPQAEFQQEQWITTIFIKASSFF